MKDFVELGLPDKMDIKRQYNAMTITRKWFGWQVIFLTVFAVVWNGIIFNNYLSVEAYSELPWIHIIAGIAVTYYAITGWCNVTNIHVTKQQIQISHKPLPWIGNKTIDSHDIKQLYVKEKTSRNRNHNSYSVSYEVHTITNSGKVTRLLSGLSTSEQALFVEQEIEKYLGIENKLVRGELS
ncbi:hypothetical protein KO525_15755 [Psychrosphaera sp. B3R10]|uniref:DUF304 domain-containing protein n=1 Tax=Psychrosphaera algicola TaxID=3023714 RepID=A0ABT5FJQ3_9GAMM|nr:MULTISPECIES: hypothetical protein [unclassified Psychrosphaera]MBU2880934.1 hypothetical protein [Psychrosphaera sp. I2R16]MBU2990847.1 hypothetical protein [Psychrosphaera sp. B3R10]MDC2891434.1 hypothetical protein [Psychrosphaera sp. G1-22]